MSKVKQGHSGLKGAVLVAGSVAVGGALGFGLDQALPRPQKPYVAHASPAAEAPPLEETAAAEVEAAPLDVAAADDGMSMDAEPGAEASAYTGETVAEAMEGSAAETDAAPMPAEPEVVAEAEPEAESAPETVSESGPAAMAAAPAASDPPRPAVRPPAPPAADVLRAWWRTPASGQLAVEFVGQLAGEQSLAILLSEPVADLSGLERAVRVLDRDGKPLSGSWRPGKDRRLVVGPTLPPGRYTVFIDRGIATADGKALQATLHGPVHIR